MKSLRAAGFVALLSASLLSSIVHAQSEEETVELSSFFASGYASDSGRIRGGDGAAKPAVAITLRRPATAVVMEVVLQNSADKPDARNREIYATIKELQRVVEATPGLKFERREIQLRGDAQRKLVLSSRGGATSYANVAVVAALSPEADLFERVQVMRSVVSGVAPAGSTKVFDGTVSLMIDNPASYRRELLKEIFADLAFVQQSLGGGFEVMPAKLDGPVRVRAASEREVELWIDYSFTIRSKIELANPSPAHDGRQL